MQKYKLSWRDISFNDFKVYLFALFKAFIPKKKIKNLDQLENFIQTKSAWVTQVTLYSYLKTRMGTRYVLHFDNDIFMSSLNIAKWNIYFVALQDLTFFTFSYLRVNFNFQNIDNIYDSIEGKYDAFSNDHVYITPRGKFGVLEFDKYDREYFKEYDTYHEYQTWAREEPENNLSDICKACSYYGKCLTEHYRYVHDLTNSCNGYKGLLDYYERMES